ncbi:septal ring lytic transglycosylase RlpA family protein [Caenispirillum bisanense]|uniref:septal ring lytic transglycosylase RlpA family protein n=1 Tax=Caenispirillum bisanense TaxID=414052 RepID=UPI0031E2F1BC
MLRQRGSFRRFAARAGVLVVASLALSACAETQLAVHTAKRMTGPVDLPPRGIYKIGKPYQIDGTWYYPKEDFRYTEEGVASWYGADFHGKPTANGEVYDMNDLTAAHRTLPMPAVVRVTNQDNGRSLILRVNDRGPFAKNRIIDISRRGAQLLGFEAKGTTRVRVEILPDESMALREAMIAAGRAEGGVAVASATGAEPAARPAPAPAPVVAAPTPPPPVVQAPAPAPVRQAQTAAAMAGGSYIQAGAFSTMENARHLEFQLQDFGPTVIVPVQTASSTLYRVRIGPLADAGEAQRLLAQVRGAGYGDAVVVTD